jgi:hypothetical protein
MAQRFWKVFAAGLLFVGTAGRARTQTAAGPMTPRPGTQIQATPPEALAKISARVTLVNTPVTVRDGEGAMVQNLDQQVSSSPTTACRKNPHFDVGGDPSRWWLWSKRLASGSFPWLRRRNPHRTGRGAEAEAAIIGFDDSVNKLQDFTQPRAVQSAFTGLQTGESGLHLFDAWRRAWRACRAPQADRQRRRQPSSCWSWRRLSITAANHSSASVAPRTAGKHHHFQRWAVDHANRNAR